MDEIKIMIAGQEKTIKELLKGVVARREEKPRRKSLKDIKSIKNN